jgi:hypothetical protein
MLPFPLFPLSHRPWLVPLALSLVACAPRSPEAPPAPSTPTETGPAAEPAAQSPLWTSASDDAAPAEDGPPAPDCRLGFVEIRDGAALQRFEHGRVLVPGQRGSLNAFAELVIHENNEVVLVVQALEGNDASDGHVSIVLTNVDRGQLVGQHSAGYIEYARGASDLEEDEFRADGPSVRVTTFGEVGQFVEGSFDAVTAHSKDGDATQLRGSFRVCRSNDWLVEK